MRRRDALATAGTFALAGCLGLESPNENDERGGGNESDPVADGEDSATGDEAREIDIDRSWVAEMGVEVGGRLVGESVYVAGAIGDTEGVIAVNGADGQVEWRCDFGDIPVGLGIASGPETAYVGSTQRDEVHAIDRRTGAIEATAEVSEIGGDGALLEGTLVTGTSGTDEDVLVGLDARTLEERWRKTGGMFFGAVAANGIVVAAHRTGYLTGRDPVDGSELWATEFPVSNRYSGPFVDERGRVFAVSAGDRSIGRIDPATGELVWTIEFDANPPTVPSVRPPAFDGDTGWIVAGPRVIAFDSNGGQRRWTSEIAGEVTSPVARTNDACWVHAVEDDSGRLYGFDPSDGERLYREERTAEDSNYRLFGYGDRLALLENDALIGYDVRGLE